MGIPIRVNLSMKRNGVPNKKISMPQSLKNPEKRAGLKVKHSALFGHRHSQSDWCK